MPATCEAPKPPNWPGRCGSRSCSGFKIRPRCRIALGATAAFAALFALGWHTRVVGVLLYAGMLSIHHRNLTTSSGADNLLMVMAFYLMISPCGAAYSLDARRARARRGGAAAEPLIVPWSLRLIQVQISILYFMTALLKARGTTWIDGTALYYVLNLDEYRRFSLGLTEFPLLIHALTLGALLTEFSLAFLLWFRATRPWAILAGIALHGSILLTVNIPLFGELLMASYLTFLNATELDALLRAVNPRAWFRRRSAVEDMARPTLDARRDGPEPVGGPIRVSSLHRRDIIET